MITGHFAAVKARLEAATVLAGKVHDSVLTDPLGGLVRATYVIIYGGSPDVLDDGRLSAEQRPSSDAEFVYTIRSVSVTAPGARAASATVFAQLIGHKPIIAGRSCAAIRLDNAGTVEADTTTTPPLYYVDDGYLLVSSRA